MHTTAPVRGDEKTETKVIIRRSPTSLKPSSGYPNRAGAVNGVTKPSLMKLFQKVRRQMHHNCTK